MRSKIGNTNFYLVKQLAQSILFIFLFAACAASIKTTDSENQDSQKTRSKPSENEEYHYFMEQAGIAQAENNLNEALDYYMLAGNAIKSKPTVLKADAHYQAADLAYRLYQKELAIEQYEIAIGIYIKFSGNAQNKAAVAYTNMGVIWKELHNKSRARSAWQQALDIYNKQPTNDQSRLHIERIKQNIRDMDEGF